MLDFLRYTVYSIQFEKHHTVVNSLCGNDALLDSYFGMRKYKLLWQIYNPFLTLLIYIKFQLAQPAEIFYSFHRGREMEVLLIWRV